MTDQRMTIGEFLKLEPVLSDHFRKTLIEKKFDGREVAALLKDPEEYYPSKSHPGQYRVTGRGLCVVGEPQGNRFVLITIYLDGVITPPRSGDNSEAALQYAARYAKGEVNRPEPLTNTP